GGRAAAPRPAGDPGGWMCARLRRSRHLRRAKPGDGSALTDLRWWQLPTRTQFFLEPDPTARRTSHCTVDVRFLAAELEGGKRAEAARHAPVEFFADAAQQCIADPPVAFAVPGGTIEVATSMYGLTRMHVVPEDGGPARPLRPHERSLEGLRARFGRRHPGASRVIGL